MNTCRMVIDHHPDTNQCGDDMITHAVHVEPINVDAPQWVLEAATRHMCADMGTEHGHFLPHLDPVIKVMGEQGFDTVVVLAPDYWDIDGAFNTNGHSRVAARLSRMPSAWGRCPQQSAVVLDMGKDTVTLTTRKAAWAAL